MISDQAGRVFRIALLMFVIAVLAVTLFDTTGKLSRALEGES